MMFQTDNSERAEAYRILSQFFLSAPDDEALKAIRQDFSLDSEDPQDKVAQDFEELFSPEQGKLQPLESVFTSTMNSGYSDVMDYYAEAGLTLDESYVVPPDHLAVELLFMSYLIANGRTDSEKEFLEEHVMNWVPYFCDEVARQAATLFYREVAQIVKDFLTAEYDEYNE